MEPTKRPSPPDYPIDVNFRHHPPFGTQTARYESIRAKAKELAAEILGSCPHSRERSVALTELETAVMWANAAIARNERPPTHDFDPSFPAIKAPEWPYGPQGGDDKPAVPSIEADPEGTVAAVDHPGAFAAKGGA